MQFVSTGSRSARKYSQGKREDVYPTGLPFGICIETGLLGTGIFFHLSHQNLPRALPFFSHHFQSRDSSGVSLSKSETARLLPNPSIISGQPTHICCQHLLSDLGNILRFFRQYLLTRNVIILFILGSLAIFY